jgi:hypothetical protein
LPEFDVAVYFLFELFGHVEFAFAENAGDAQDEFLFGTEFGVVNLEGGEEAVVVPFEVYAAGSVFLDLCPAGTLIGGTLDDFLQVTDVEIERFHGVEEILGGGALQFKLMLNAPGIAAGSEQDNGQKGDEPMIFTAFAGLDGDGGAADEGSVFPDGLTGVLGEIVLDIAGDDGAVTFQG